MNVEASTTQDDLFQQQIEVLKKHLMADPRSLRNIFVADGTQAMAWEFQQPEISEKFIGVLWNLLLKEDDMSTMLQRFLWDLPLKFKRKFVRALDQHLSGRYPMFDGLSEGWPADNFIPPYVRPPEDRAEDFELVNTGYLGYRALGYSLREVDLFVWLEVMRDKQCDDRPCELGVLKERIANRAETKIGGCPVKIHIPEMLDLMGKGKIKQALQLIESANPLPNVTGRVCPQENQCQGVCKHTKRPIEIGQLEWYLPEHEKLADEDRLERFKGIISPWERAEKPPVAIVGSGPSGLINAYLLAVEGFPVTVFEAFHELGGVLRYGIPEFRLPNSLIDDVVQKIDLLGGKFVKNFVVGKSATLDDLKNAGFWKIFVGSGAGLPTFMNVPGEHLNGVMSANEFLTRVNLMRGRSPEFETPLPEVKDRHILIVGGGNTAMDAARTARRLGGKVTIVYRRTKAEMPARVEELHHALEEGIDVAELRGPTEFVGDSHTHFVTHAIVDINELGEPDASGRRRPQATGKQITMPADLVIMALGNKSNPIIPEAEPDLKLSKWGTIEVEDGQETSIKDVYTGGDAARGGSTAILAAGDGQAAARQIVGDIPFDAEEIKKRVEGAKAYTDMGQARQVITVHRDVADGIVEMSVHAPVVAKAAKAGQFVRVLASDDGELIPLTLADWDAEKGTIDIVIQGLGTSSKLINLMQEGEAFSGIAGPLGRPSDVHAYAADETVVFTAGGVGLPAILPIAKAHLEKGNHATMIIGFRSAGHLFWTGDDDRMGKLKAKYGDQLDIIYCTNDGTFGTEGFVTGPLGEMLKDGKMSKGRKLAEVISVGPPMMMRAVSDLTQPYEVPTVVSLNSIMVDATGMCGACMVPVLRDGKPMRMHACIDGPEFDAHTVEWDKFMPRFNQFKAQEVRSLEEHGLA